MAIPIVMILLVAASIYVPGLFIHPKYSFLYVTGSDYYDGLQYAIQNGKLIKSVEKPAPNQKPRVDQSQLSIMDVPLNESKTISLDDAQKLKLDPSAQSPDGFEVLQGNQSRGVFPFFDFAETDYNTIYLRGHNASKKLNARVTSTGNYGNYYTFRFLGWIVQ